MTEDTDPRLVGKQAQNLLNEEYQAIGDSMISCGVDNMEKYK